MKVTEDGMPLSTPLWLLLVVRRALHRVTEPLRQVTAEVAVSSQMPEVIGVLEEGVMTALESASLITIEFSRDFSSISSPYFKGHDALNELLELTVGDRLFFGYQFVQISTNDPERYDFRQLVEAIAKLYDWTVTQLVVVDGQSG